MEDCVGVISGWLRKSVSEATWVAYIKVCQEWESLATWAAIDPCGPDVRGLLFYWVARCMEDGVSVSVLNQKMAGLAFLFKLRGCQDFTKDFWVRQALKGYRKARMTRDVRRPVSFSVLQGLVGQLPGICSSEYESALFKVAFILAFFGAFRIGELVSPSKKRPGGLSYQEVSCGRDRVSLWLRKSKMDQMGKGREVLLFALPGSTLCPVGAVRAFLDMRPGAEGSFLIHGDGSPLSRYQFVTIFKKGLRAGGVDEKSFSSHSFRIGAATEAHRCGLGVEVVKQIGRWESRRFRSYVRPHLLDS